MQDKDLYQQLLGMKEPWQVTDVKVDFAGLRVDVWLAWPPDKRGGCPECDRKSPVYDCREERQWRHLDTMQFQTVLHCRIPRVKCKEHGVKSMAVPWAEKNSRFTALFERLAIDVLLGCQNQTKARELLKLSWDEVHAIQERAVLRGLARRTEDSAATHIGVDEKNFLRGQSYVTVVSDLDDPKVIEVARDRKEESLKTILLGMPEQQRAEIEAVAVDMWLPFINTIQAVLPEADIVHDKFHIMKYLSEAVDKVRRTENKDLIKKGIEYLKGTRYLWLTNPEKWTEEQREEFRSLRKQDLKVGRAWTLKDRFPQLWDYTYEKSARNFFKKWYWLATHSRLKPMVEVAKMIHRHLDNILTYLKHRITNAVAEGLNSKIQQVKTAARGFRNYDNYRIAILFFCGKLNMHPQKSL